MLPPTPPLGRNDSVFEHTHSPSTISTGSSLSVQPFHNGMAGSALNNMDADHQRVVQSNFMKRHSVPSQPNTSPYGQSPYQTSPYTASPGNLSTGSFYSPTDPSYPASSLYRQRPLPSNFPPPPPPNAAVVQQTTPALVPTANPWEHHHYISPSSHCLLYTSPSPRDGLLSRMPSSA